MEYRAAVITMSDKGSQGLREDTAGDAVVKILEDNGWKIEYRTMIPDDMEQIKSELIKCADELAVTSRRKRRLRSWTERCAAYLRP